MLVRVILWQLMCTSERERIKTGEEKSYPAGDCQQMFHCSSKRASKRLLLQGYINSGQFITGRPVL